MVEPVTFVKTCSMFVLGVPRPGVVDPVRPPFRPPRPAPLPPVRSAEFASRLLVEVC